MIMAKLKAKIVVLLVLTFLAYTPVTTATDEIYPKLLDMPWDHSPITVYIEEENIPPHYSPTYRAQIDASLEYWEAGGNGHLNYVPQFQEVDRTDADITIMWVENLETVAGAPEGVAGYCIYQQNGDRYTHASIILEVGNYQGYSWQQYGDTNMQEVAKHELGHALGLAHSTDKRDIMYPTYEARENLNPLLLRSTLPYLIIALVIGLAILGYLGIGWRRSRCKRKELEEEVFGEWKE